MFKIYRDLLIDKVLYTEQLEFANDTLITLENLLTIRKPHDMKAMGYDSVGQACRDDTTDDRTGARYLYTKKRIEAYEGILAGIEIEIKKVEIEAKKYDGLYHKVFDLNRMQKVPLEKVAEQLNYSISYIEKISAEIGRSL